MAVSVINTMLFYPVIAAVYSYKTAFYRSGVLMPFISDKFGQMVKPMTTICMKRKRQSRIITRQYIIIRGMQNIERSTTSKDLFNLFIRKFLLKAVSRVPPLPAPVTFTDLEKSI